MKSRSIDRRRLPFDQAGLHRLVGRFIAGALLGVVLIGVGGANAAAGPTPSTSLQLDVGADLYQLRCSGCHGLGGEGGRGPSLQTSTLPLQGVIDRITNGGQGMPAFSGVLTAAEIEAVALFVIEFRSQGSTTTSTAPPTTTTSTSPTTTTTAPATTTTAPATTTTAAPTTTTTASTTTTTAPTTTTTTAPTTTTATAPTTTTATAPPTTTATAPPTTSSTATSTTGVVSPTDAPEAAIPAEPAGSPLVVPLVISGLALAGGLWFVLRRRQVG